jgi:hypothetical protein
VKKYGFIPRNHSKPVFFPINEGKVYDEVGKAIPNHKRIYRGDTGDTLHIATSSYAMVPYERHFEQFEDAIERSALKSDDMLIATDMSDNGARIFRQYLFPSIREEFLDSKGLQHGLALRIVMFDSYNGTSAFVGKTGFFNFVCANEAVMGKSILDVRFKHTGDMENRVQTAAGQLTAAADKFVEDMRRLVAWVKVPMPIDTATFLAEKIPQSNKRLTDELIARFARDRGDTLWDFHQLLSSWSTHDIPVKTKNDRQKRVTDLVEGEHWKMLEPA